MSQPPTSRQRVISICYKLGLILLFGSPLLHLLYPSVFFGYLLMTGALLYTISQVLTDKHGVDLCTKRLRGMALLAGILFVSGSYLSIVEQSYQRLVLVTVLIPLLYPNTALLYHKPQAPKGNQVD